jgi:hypothetical protein
MVVGGMGPHWLLRLRLGPGGAVSLFPREHAEACDLDAETHTALMDSSVPCMFSSFVRYADAGRSQGIAPFTHNIPAVRAPTDIACMWTSMIGGRA